MLKGEIFKLTMSEIDGMVPRFRRRLNKDMYLMHIYKVRDIQFFGFRQIYRYSWSEVRITSYRSSAVDRR